MLDRWELPHAVIGTITSDGMVRIRDGAHVVADVPVTLFTEQCPAYVLEGVEDPEVQRMRSTFPLRFLTAATLAPNCCLYSGIRMPAANGEYGASTTTLSRRTPLACRREPMQLSSASRDGRMPSPSPSTETGVAATLSHTVEERWQCSKLHVTWRLSERDHCA